MSDSRKYYYLKLKDNFFDTDEMIILESMPDGYLYSNILLKLYLRSLKYNGRLMFNEKIPFNSQMLATITRHSIGVIEKSMTIFKELNLVEILDSGAIYMTDMQNFIGESSTEADRKREYRNKIAIEKGQMSGQIEDKSPPEIEIELDTEIELEKDICNSVVEKFNSVCVSLPRLIKLTDTRKKTIKSRLAELGNDLTKLEEIFTLVENSDFLTGRSSSWQANFDWVMKPANFVKILEGNYKNKEVANARNKSVGIAPSESKYAFVDKAIERRQQQEEFKPIDFSDCEY